MKTFAEKVIAFNEQLDFKGELPENISIMNPFKENPNILPVSSVFYKKYYSDNQTRHIIFGINPGRLGAGLTGIPFTDPKRLVEKCNIDYKDKLAHEPSSVFIYDMIEAYGGIELFYKNFYINSVCPLGFTSVGKNGKAVNYNYYDKKELTSFVKDFIIESIEKQITFGISTDICFCLGTGENFKFLLQLNNEKQFFKRIIPLDHPRFVVQYKSSAKQEYIDKYIAAFDSIKRNL